MTDQTHARAAPESADETVTKRVHGTDLAPAVDPLATASPPAAPQPAVETGGLEALLRPSGARPASGGRSGAGDQGHWSDWMRRALASPRARDVALSLLVVLAAVSVVLATRSGRSTTAVGADQPGSTSPPAPGAVRIVAQERAAGGSTTLTVSVPGAPRAAVLPSAAFEVSLDGRPIPANVEPVPAAAETVAVVANTSADATKGDLQAAGNGLTELLLQLPKDGRVAVVGTAGPALLQPVTGDVTSALGALDRVTPAGTAAPGAAIRLAAQQVASAPRLRRAVLVVGSTGIAQSQQEVADATLSAQTAGTPVYLVGTDALGSDALRSALATTGGAAYEVSADAPLGAYDTLAADLANQYRLTFPAPATPAAVTVRVQAPIASGTAGSTVDPQLP